MKKSLSVLVATAMVSSMFASVAFAADDELTTQQKLEELIAAGIFDKDGTGNGYELDAHMTREQLAKILAKLKKLEEVSGTSYTDVAANRWSAGFIQAVSKVVPPLMDGVADGVFDPAGDVTLEQLATVAVRALNLQVKSDAEVEGEVSDWAKGYVATALENGLIGEKDDYTEPAIRSDLVETTYTAREILAEQEVPEKVSVKEAKAVGVKSVEVTLDKEVDTDKAEFTLKKGTQTITLDTAATKWSDDKKTATLKLKDVKISEGEYTVTLGGIDAAEIATASASFKAENEKVTKLEFVNSSEKIAKSKSVTIKLKASNQYGENATISAGNYTAYVAGETKSLKRNEDTGLLELQVNTVDKPSGGEYQSELDVLPVNVFLTNSNISVQRTFKIGTEPYVTKIELGNVKYPNEKSALSSQGEIAEIPITRYDQYGDVISYSSSYDSNFLNRLKFDAIITPYSFDSLSLVDKDIIDQDHYDKVKVKLDKNVEKTGEYNIQVFVGAASATAKLNVQSTKVATKVDFGTFNGVLAEGDKDKYIPIIAYDAEGNQLSAQEIVDNAKANRFSISISGADYDGDDNGNAAIVATGEHKGKIRLKEIKASQHGVVYINIGIYTANVNDHKSQSFPVQEARKPAAIVVDGSKPAQKAMAGATTTVKFYVKDQHDEKLSSTIAKYVNDYKVRITVTGTTYATFNGGTTITLDGNGQAEFNASEFGDKFNSKELKLTALNPGTAKIKVELIQTSNNNSVLSTAESSMQVLPDNTELTYSVNAIGDLFAALDSSLTPASDKELTPGADWAFDSKLAREVKVSAKDKSGDTVALPSGLILSAAPSDQTVARSVYEGNTWKVIGNKAGTTNVNVVYKKLDGNNGDATVTVNTKSDLVKAAKITSDATGEITVVGGVGDKKAFHADVGNFKVTDNYGIEYSGDNIYKYFNFLGVAYSASDIVGSGSVSISNDGTITVNGTVEEFVLKAITGTGLTATTLVKVN
jgi:hypothetical protein